MKTASGIEVLVLDADMVPALTISRSLARRGCRVTVASHIAKPVASRSRTSAACFTYPDPLSRAEDFIRWLQEHTQTHDYQLVMPVTERTLVPLSRSRALFEHVNLAMPEARSLELVLDKSQTLAMAEELGVPIPKGIHVRSLEQLYELGETLHYPVVIKPSRSIGSGEQGASHLQVSYAFDAVGLVSGCRHALRFGSVVLQEYFRGDGVGVELIAQHGEVFYAFQHRRLHEVPLTGGGSSLRKSEPLRPELLEASRALVRAMNWHGVAMVEFKLDRATGAFCLMEINGRFWGSLPLADAAGADFPGMLLHLELENERRPVPDYRENMHCRLLSRDLLWYESVLRGEADERIVELPDRKAILRELGLFLSPRHRFDVQKLSDPWPGIVDIGTIINTYWQRISTLLEDKRFLRRQRSVWRSGQVAKAIGSAESMLFMCYGNINRSALADVMVRAYAEDTGLSIHSAGFHQESGRPADPVMVEIAADHGVDMSALRSTAVTEEQLRRSDIIFVMEKRHFDRIVEMRPDVANKTFLLGAYPGAEAGPAEIEDPYGRSRAAYLRCFEHISGAIDHVKSLLAVRSAD